jgi:diacylglycerol kinase family enzyme
MLVFLNPTARGGTGLKRWEATRERLRERGLLQELEIITDTERLQSAVLRQSECGDGRVVAVGGDGTVNRLVDEIMRLPRPMRERLILGAIGTGSSNDFHKPYQLSDCIVPGVPLRLGWSSPQSHNVGQMNYLGTDKKWYRRYFVVNSSFGVLAAANQFFNSPCGLVAWLKPRWLNLCIWYAGLRTLMTEPAFEAVIHGPFIPIRGAMMNLSILLNQHVSGGFTIDIPVSSSTTSFGIALCEEMNKMRRLRTLASMARGHFVGLPGTQAFQTEEIEVQACRPVPLELDGEVFMATQVHVKLLHGAIRVCSRQSY